MLRPRYESAAASHPRAARVDGSRQALEESPGACLGFPEEDPALHSIRREAGLLVRLVGSELLEPAAGLVAVPFLVVGHREEGPILGGTPTPPDAFTLSSSRTIASSIRPRRTAAAPRVLSVNRFCLGG